MPTRRSPELIEAIQDKRKPDGRRKVHLYDPGTGRPGAGPATRIVPRQSSHCAGPPSIRTASRYADRLARALGAVGPQAEPGPGRTDKRFSSSTSRQLSPDRSGGTRHRSIASRWTDSESRMPQRLGRTEQWLALAFSASHALPTAGHRTRLRVGPPAWRYWQPGLGRPTWPTSPATIAFKPLRVGQLRGDFCLPTITGPQSGAGPHKPPRAQAHRPRLLAVSAVMSSVTTWSDLNASIGPTRRKPSSCFLTSARRPLSPAWSS